MTKSLFCCLAVLALLLAQLPARASDDEYALRQITHSQGLSNSAVLSLYQDNRGLMWFGTYDGLNFYDSKSMEVFRADVTKPNVLLNNVIYGVNGADGDCIWISTAMGVSRFSVSRKCAIATYNRFKDGYRLLSNRSGDTWVTDRNQVYHYNIHTAQFDSLTIDYPDFCEALSFVDESGNLWLFSDTGHNVYYCQALCDEQNRWSYSLHLVELHPHSVGYTFYQNGMLNFIDSRNDLYLYDIERSSKVFICPVGELLATYGPLKGVVSFQDDIILAFEQNGLLKLNAARHYEAEVIDRSLRIFDIATDIRQDIVWVATDGMGTMTYSRRHILGTQLMYNELGNRLTRQVRSIFTDAQGDLWFGTKGDGLVRICDYSRLIDKRQPDKQIYVYAPNAKSPLERYERGLKEYQVFGLEESRYANGFWIGAADPGLAFYDRAADRIRPVTGFRTEVLKKVHRIYEQNDTTLWVTTGDSGLCKVTLAPPPVRTQARKVRQFIFDSQGKSVTNFFPMNVEGDSVLWLGSIGYGLVRFNMRTEAYRIYPIGGNHSVTLNDILSIHRKDSVFYLGTVSGLVKWRPGDDFRVKKAVLGREQGMLNDMIHGILEDKSGFLWLSTNKGLVKYNPKNDAFHTYYYSNDLQIGEFSDDAYLKCPYTGNLFFGGVNGLILLGEEVNNNDTFFPKIFVRDIELNGEPVRYDDHYDERRKALVFQGVSVDLSVRYVAPDYKEGDNYEYSYRLKGFKNEWTAFSSNNLATLKSVPYGNYVLELRYKKDVFDMSYHQRDVALIVFPPWYLSSSAYLFYFSLLMMAFFLIARFLVKYYRRGRMVRELMLREQYNVAEDITGRRLHMMPSSFGVIYSLCGKLQQYVGMPPAYYKLLDEMHESLLTDAFNNDEVWTDTMMVKKNLGALQSMSGEVNLKETSDEVIRMLMQRGCEHLADLQIEVSADERVYMPVSLLRYILFFLYSEASLVQGSVQVVIACHGDKLSIVLRFPPEGAEQLRQIEAGKMLQQPEANETPFKYTFYHALYLHAVERLDGSVSRFGHDLTLLLSLPRREEPVSASAGEPRPKVLFLEGRPELAWYVEDLLSARYEVHTVSTIKAAFSYLHRYTPEVFLADMQMFLNEENKFMEYMQTNKGLFQRVAFIPLISWKAALKFPAVYRALTTAMVVMPYNLMFLGEIVDQALRGRGDGVSPVPKDTLTDMAETEVTVEDDDEVEDTAFAKRLYAVIESHLDKEDLTTAFVASELNISTRQYYRKLKEITNLSSTDFIKSYRITRAAALLLETNLSVQDIIGKVGIQSRSYFYKEFTNRYGTTPKAYKQSMKNNTPPRLGLNN